MTPRDALAALRARRGRTLLAAVGVLAASLVVGTATTVGYSLATGFDRAAEQRRPARRARALHREPRGAVDARVSRAAEPRGALLPHEQLNQRLVAGAHPTAQGRGHRGARRAPRLPDRRGPRPARRRGRRRRDRARARARVGPGVGDTLTVADRALPARSALRVVGIAVSPDNVAFPLASAARVYVSEQEFVNALGCRGGCGRTWRCCGSTTRPRPTSRYAGARGRVRARQAAVHHPHGRERSCSRRPPGS